MNGNKNNDPQRLSAPDRALWERVKKSATPLENRDALFTSLLNASAANPNAGSNWHSKLEREFGEGPAIAPKKRRIVKPFSPTPANAAPYTLAKQAVQHHELDQKTVRKISKGRVGIDVRVDLHGMTQLQAHSRLFNAIESAWENNQRIILVITGKGYAGEGILRQAVPRWLNEPEFRMMVSGISEANNNHGGAGALYVRIRRQVRYI